MNDNASVRVEKTPAMVLSYANHDMTTKCDMVNSFVTRILGSTMASVEGATLADDKSRKSA